MAQGVQTRHPVYLCFQANAKEGPAKSGPTKRFTQEQGKGSAVRLPFRGSLLVAEVGKNRRHNNKTVCKLFITLGKPRKQQTTHRLAEMMVVMRKARPRRPSIQYSGVVSSAPAVGQEESEVGPASSGGGGGCNYACESAIASY